ncbi:MAG: tetratricopeptide repeat protein [Ktedonobacteraceae bacterium]
MSEDIQEYIAELNQQIAELYQEGCFELGVNIATRVCATARQRLGEDHPDYATSLNNLATLYRAIGDYTQAETLYLEALTIQRKVLGEEHLDLAISLNNLATLYYMMGEYTKAEPLFQQALTIQGKVLGEEHLDLATSLNNFALLYRARGEYTKAEALLRQASDIARNALGEGHPDLATSLNNLALLYHTMGEYAKAELFYRQASDIWRTALGEEHPDVALALNNLAMLYYTTGEYVKAEPLYRECLRIWRKTLGEAHPNVAQCLNNLAVLYYAIGDYTQAESLYRQALEIRRKSLGEEHPDVAETLNNLAMLYYAMGEYVQAEPLYQQALAIWRKTLGRAHPNVAQCLNNLAELYRAVGNYAKVEPLLEQAVDIRRKVLGAGHPDLAQSLNNLAFLYYVMGKYTQAEPLMQEALKIWRTSLGEEHPHVAIILNSLALLYHSMGQYVQAEPLFRVALDIRRKVLGEAHPEVAISLNNLAFLYYTMGDYVKAEPLYQQALEICRTVLGEEHPDVATGLHNLAALYDSMGKYAQAETLYQQALAIQHTVLGEEHLAVAGSLHNLAALYVSMGDYKKAEPLYHQTLEIWRTVLGEAHPNVALSLSGLAVVYASIGDYAKAEPLYQQALEIRRAALGEMHPDVVASLNNLSDLYVVTDRKVEALTLMRQANAIDDQMVEQIFSIGSERQRMAYLVTLQGRFEGFLSLILQHFSQSALAVQAGLDLVLRRKAIGAEALAVQRDAVLGGRYPALQPKLGELATLRAQIAHRTLSGPGPEGLEVHQQLLTEWTAQREQLESELVRQIPEMNLAWKLQAADRQAIADALPLGTVLVEFVHFDTFDFQAVPARGETRWKLAHYVAFVLHAGEPESVQFIDLGEADPIDQEIGAFRASIIGEFESSNLRHLKPLPLQPGQKTYGSQGIALRKTLFDPLLRAFDGRTQLFLAPDGDLTWLPFEVLPTDDGHHLIDEYQISYLSTGRDALRFGATSTGQPAPPLVVADPDFDLTNEGAIAPKKVIGEGRRLSRDLDRSMLNFGRLAGTQIEGEQIAFLLSVHPWLQENALEGYLKECTSPCILHIATHGFFLADQQRDPEEMLDRETRVALDDVSGRLKQLSGQRLENPLLRSGLALAGVNTWNRGGLLPPEAEDGLLTAEDVTGLDLLATELVVLSACETGLGEVHIGEGVFGLRRAFMLAGAKTLVMSLWKVPDQQTQELMVDFYQRILAGQPRANALREARIALKAKYPHPYHWGAFICQGDPGPLSWQKS